MAEVGFFGGPSLYVLGPAQDVLAFFACVRRYVKLSSEETALMERIERRYVRREDVAASRSLMKHVQETLKLVHSVNILWQELGIDTSATELNKTGPSLADVFAKFFERFELVVGSYEEFLREFKIDQPVRLVLSEMPAFMDEKERPLLEYDTLEHEPFWLQAS